MTAMIMTTAAAAMSKVSVGMPASGWGAGVGDGGTVTGGVWVGVMVCVGVAVCVGCGDRV